MKTEDPLVNSYSPGESLARIARLRGVLRREQWISAPLPADAADKLAAAADALNSALESGERAAIEAANQAAGDVFQELHDAATQPGVWAQNSAQALAALAFSDPTAETPLGPVDLSTLVVTHSQPQRQMMTTIAFDHAPGAKAYRLRTIRIIEGEEVHDDTMTSLTPAFRRVRIPAGPHRLRIESRDHSGIALSDEFIMEVPEPS